MVKQVRVRKQRFASTATNTNSMLGVSAFEGVLEHIDLYRPFKPGEPGGSLPVAGNQDLASGPHEERGPENKGHELTGGHFLRSSFASRTASSRASWSDPPVPHV